MRLTFDGTLTKTVLAQARAEGISVFTHKLGESINNVDPTAATALAAGRDVGIEFLGGYWFNHGNDKPVDEVNAFLAEANRHEPWWKDFPGWFWQADLERSAAGLPSPAWAAEFCDRMADRTGRLVVAYASRGQYGNTLTGLKHPLWNAAYPSSRQAPFRDLYPGDSGSGWTKYSGQVPVFWQYSSSATIAGRTTCDANAFRGDVAGLRALITGSSGSGDVGVDMTAVDLTPAAIEAVRSAIWNTKLGNPGSVDESPGGMLSDLRASILPGGSVAATLAALRGDETAEAAALAALQSAFAGLPAAVVAALPPVAGGQPGFTDAQLAQVEAAAETAVAGVLGRTTAALTVAPPAPPAG